MTDYQKQATDFLAATNTEFKCEFLEHGKHFADDKESRDIYKITIKRGQRKYSFNFGQSLNNSGEFIVKDKNHKFTKTFTSKADAHNYASKIGNSFNVAKNPNFKAPTPYDVLACLEKYPVNDFEDFCRNYGYDTDSRKAYKTYKAVKREWENVNILFNDAEIEKLREIQ